MTYELDLTKNNFEKVDFTEAIIVDFYCQKTLPQTFEFSIWGATLLLSSFWKHSEDFDEFFPKSDDMYVSGIGKVKFTKLIGGSIEVYAYDNVVDQCNRIVNAYNRDGTELVFNRTWKTDESKVYDEYLWECVIRWPYGFCILKLHSNNGTVTYEFETDHLIPASEFLRAPENYTYK